MDKKPYQALKVSIVNSRSRKAPVAYPAPLHDCVHWQAVLTESQ